MDLTSSWLLANQLPGRLMKACQFSALPFPLVNGVVFMVAELSPGAWSRALNEGDLVMKGPLSFSHHYYMMK